MTQVWFLLSNHRFNKETTLRYLFGRILVAPQVTFQLSENSSGLQRPQKAVNTDVHSGASFPRVKCVIYYSLCRMCNWISGDIKESKSVQALIYVQGFICSRSPSVSFESLTAIILIIPQLRGKCLSFSSRSYKVRFNYVTAIKTSSKRCFLHSLFFVLLLRLLFEFQMGTNFDPRSSSVFFYTSVVYLQTHPHQSVTLSLYVPLFVFHSGNMCGAKWFWNKFLTWTRASSAFELNTHTSVIMNIWCTSQ